MKSNDLKSISDLEHGNHLCCLYETEEEQVAQLTPFILKGLGEQEKVFFHIDSLTSERLLEIWESKEPVIARAFHDGQLSLLTDRDPFTRSGAFSPDGMITSMRTLEKRALEEGFTGLRVAAEATWLFSGMTDSSLFVELESKLSRFLPISRCALLIQYDRWIFDPSFLLDVLASHPVAVYGIEVYDNIYHVPPEELLKRDISSTSLRLWLANLQANQLESQILRNSEANFRGIFNTVNDAILIRDIETFEFVDANQKAQEMFGMTLEEIKQAPVGSMDFDLVSTGRTEFLSVLDEVIQGTQRTVEWMARSKQGRYFWVESNLTRGLIGGVERLVSTVRDISERKQAEEALRETRDYLDSLITYANAPIIVWDPERKITRFNHAFEHLTSYFADEVVGKDLELLFPMDTGEESLRKIGNALAGEYWESVEIPILAKDGETRIALWNSANIYDDSGTVLLATIAQGQDISGRKQAEEALRASEASFRGVFNAVTEAIIIRDIESFHIVDANLTAQEMFGYSLEELKGAPAEIFSSGEGPFDAEAARRVMRETAEGTPQLVIWKGKHKDGHTFWVESSIAPAEIDGKQRLVGTIRDVSWRKEVEERLRQSQELNDYAHTISHDLRAPLATIHGYVQVAQDACSEGREDVARDTLAIIHRLTERMSELVNSLLQQAQAGKPEGNVDRVSLDEVLVDPLQHQALTMPERD